MHDNAPCHTAKRVKQYLTEENIKVMNWTAHSPDLNPIENQWHIIGEQVRKRKPTTVEHLWSIIQDEWNKITPELCKKLSRSCGRRCVEQIKTKGYTHHTNYIVSYTNDFIVIVLINNKFYTFSVTSFSYFAHIHFLLHPVFLYNFKNVC